MSYAIRVENLSKRYRIRHGDNASYRTLRDEIVHALGAPLRRLRGQGETSTEEFWALQDVNFDVQPGEVVGVIGRNGAGKSTLLKILSRITKPTTGRVAMRGRVGSLLEVGTGFHPELTGRENIFLSGAILGMKRAEIAKKFDEIVAFAEVERFLDTPVKRYSSGMFVRLAFSVAAHLEPEILMIDEVLAVGDAQFQRKCLGKLQNAAGDGRTIVFVSHYLTAVCGLCSKAVYLREGQIAGFGNASTVAAQYTADMRQSSGLDHPEGNLANVARSRHLPRELQLLHVTLRNNEGAISTTFVVGEGFLVDVRVRSTISYDHAVVALAVRAADGVDLFASGSDDVGQLFCISPGEFILRCRVEPGYLRPGSYSVALSCTAKSLQDLVADAISFDILPSDRQNESTSFQAPGYFRFHHTWELVDEPCAQRANALGAPTAFSIQNGSS